MHKFIDPLVRPNYVQMRHSSVQNMVYSVVNGGEGGSGGYSCTYKEYVQ